MKNPFALRESLKIAVEVSYPLLVPTPHKSLNSIINRIPNILNESSIQLSKSEMNLLRTCLERFRNTNTFRWVRPDFIEAVIDAEKQLKKELKI
jgi:hypothetical protein